MSSNNDDECGGKLPAAYMAWFTAGRTAGYQDGFNDGFTKGCSVPDEDCPRTDWLFKNNVSYIEGYLCWFGCQKRSGLDAGGLLVEAGLAVDSLVISNDTII